MKLRLVAAVALALATFASRALAAAPLVWTLGDGVRVRPEDTGARGGADPGHASVSLFALRGETVAFQVAVRAGDEALDDVTAELESPSAVGAKRAIASSWVERYVEWAVPTWGRTRNVHGEDTLGWATVEARPAEPSGRIPDALLPVEHAPSWAPYPLTVSARTTSALWIDVTVPEDARAGRYASRLRVRAAGGAVDVRIPVELEVRAALLPFDAARTMIDYDVRELRARLGSDAAELRLWQLFHRFHLTPLLSADDVGEIERIRPALDGSAFTAERGYRGPGVGRGAEVVALGAYGSLGEPGPGPLARVAAMVHALAAIPAHPRVFLYAIDERCDSDRAARWRASLRASGDPLLAALRVGETCDRRPPERAADLVMVTSAGFDHETALDARAAGKWLWVYNGRLPRSGPLMLDVPPIDLRVNGWIASAFDVDRWFYWESTFWNDDNRGGRGPADPFATAETFHNADGDTALADGLLVYPGRQIAFPDHSLGLDDVLPSIRLANLRRGVEDAGYVALAAARDRDRTEALVRAAVPAALDELDTEHRAPAWSDDPRPLDEARRALFDLVPAGASLDDDAVARALRTVALARRAHVRRSPEAPRASVGVAIVAWTALAWAVRRAGRGHAGRSRPDPRSTGRRGTPWASCDF